jgi:hypothetical protein
MLNLYRPGCYTQLIADQTRYVYNAFIEELHGGAKTMIYYFHYNNKGSHPFSRDWTCKKNIGMAELSDEQARFLVETSEEVQRRRELRSSYIPHPFLDTLLTSGHTADAEFERVRKSDDFENDFYFLSQLYEMNWGLSLTI